MPFRFEHPPDLEQHMHGIAQQVLNHFATEHQGEVPCWIRKRVLLRVEEADVISKAAAAHPCRLLNGFARRAERGGRYFRITGDRSEEHTSELQSLRHLVCRLLLEKKKRKHN